MLQFHQQGIFCFVIVENVLSSHLKGVIMQKKLDSGLIELKNISKSFGGEPVLKSIDLSITDGEFVTLLGPSGCGKTTLLRIIGGFEAPDSGEVFFDGQEISDIPPNKRNINTVFQKYALFPHLNVHDNIAFGLKLKDIDHTTIDVKVAEMLEMMNLKGFENRMVTSLSGGQQQRVAIARALINKPKLLLLDEPLGALDLKLRKEMQIELKNIHRSLDMTFIYVTHDQEEALTLSDTVIVINNGQIFQQGSPIAIYNEPINAFVADFIGESNIIPGRMPRDCAVDFLGTTYDCVDAGFKENEEIDMVLRPEDILLIDKQDHSFQKSEALLEGEIMSCLFKGVHYQMRVKCRDFEFLIDSTVPQQIGAIKQIDIEPENIHIMRKMP